MSADISNYCVQLYITHKLPAFRQADRTLGNPVFGGGRIQHFWSVAIAAKELEGGSQTDVVGHFGPNISPNIS